MPLIMFFLRLPVVYLYPNSDGSHIVMPGNVATSMTITNIRARNGQRSFAASSMVQWASGAVMKSPRATGE